MAKLIVKSPYIKGSSGGAGGYAKYIGTRDGVELLPSGYMEYMSERPRSHGLFGDKDNVDMDTVMQDLNEYPGNIWTHIISLKREDTERLGYDHAAQWKNLLRAHRNEITEAMHIPPSDFRWYAAFHDEGDHPHIHMMAWSTRPGQAYLSKDGIRQIKSKLTNDIFRQEMLHLDKISFEDSGSEQIATDFSSLPYDCWEQWVIMQDDTAPLVERDEAAAKLIAIAEDGDLYAQYLVGRLYQDGPVLIPDSVEALHWFEQAARQGHPAASYEMGKILLSDDAEVHDPAWEMQWLEYAARVGNGCAAYRLGKEYLKGEIVPKDTAKAMDYFIQAAESGNQYAQYAVGELYLEEHNQEQANYWFTQSASQGNRYAQFFLNRWDSLKPPSVMLAATRLLHHMGRIFQNQTPSPPTSGSIQVDRKLMARIREKKIAMGHKPDDHGEPSYGQMMGK